MTTNKPTYEELSWALINVLDYPKNNHFMRPGIELILSNLSLKEIADLEDKIRRHKEQRKDLRVYEVKFYFGFLQGTRGHHGSVITDYPDSLKRYLEELSDTLIKRLNICAPEGVSPFQVEELDAKEFPAIFTP